MRISWPILEDEVSPAPILRKHLTKAIAAAVTDPSMRERAAALGEHIRAEDGIGQAVEVIEKNRR